MTQRRRFYRHPVWLDIRWSFAEDDLPFCRQAKAISLAGCGLVMRGCEEPVPRPGNKVVIELRLGSKQPLYLAAAVIRDVEPQVPDAWCIAAEFRSIEPRQIDAIVSYVMSLQACSIRDAKEKDEVGCCEGGCDGCCGYQ